MKHDIMNLYIYLFWGKRYCSWLMTYATNRKAEGSIPDEVVNIFQLANSSSRTMALGLNRPLKEMSTRKSFWRLKRGLHVRPKT
jgi:hypothetical protein